MFSAAMMLTGVVSAQELRTAKDSLSYALGQDMARTVRSMGLEVDQDILTNALKRSLEVETDDLRFDEGTAQQIIRKQILLIREAQEAAAKKEGEARFAELISADDVTVGDDGVGYQVLHEGSGPHAGDAQKVEVHYIGKLADGTEFDNSYARGEPLSLTLASVIKGWQLAIPRMSKGAKYRFYIPYQLGYGTSGSGPIPPYAALIFDIELLDFEVTTVMDEI